MDQIIHAAIIGLLLLGVTGAVVGGPIMVSQAIRNAREVERDAKRIGQWVDGGRM